MDISPLPSTEYTKPINDPNVKSECDSSWKHAFYCLLGVFIVSLMTMLIFCGSHDDFTNRKENMDSESRYADCPNGYKLAGDICIPSSKDGIKQTCPQGGASLVNGVCRIRTKAKCPDGYFNMDTKCMNYETKLILPIDQSTCEAGYTQNGGTCERTYLGTCPLYFKNSKEGVNACVQEFESMVPQCNSGETLKDGRCYTGSVESFARANEIEAKALASLNI